MSGDDLDGGPGVAQRREDQRNSGGRDRRSSKPTRAGERRPDGGADTRGGRGRNRGLPADRDVPSPRPHRQSKRPQKPELPRERGRIRRDVYRELKTAGGKDAEEVMRAYSGAGVALEAGDVPRAVELLTWAKSTAARSGAIREALGIALYMAGDYSGAHRELMAYRRLSNRFDQNHLLADCARATGRSEKVVEYVEEMEAQGVPRDRVAEGLIVLAGDRADRGEYEAALAALSRAGLSPDVVEDHQPRLWYAAADIHERMGEPERARDYLEAIAAVTEDFLDVEERLRD